VLNIFFFAQRAVREKQGGTDGRTLELLHFTVIYQSIAVLATALSLCRQLEVLTAVSMKMTSGMLRRVVW
jgi:hypothetical protein